MEHNYLTSGSIFDEDYREIHGAYRFAMEEHNNVSSAAVRVFVDIISTRDAFKIARLSEN